MTENLCPPGFPNQIIVLKNAAMGFEFCTRLKRENEMFVAQADELGKITVMRNGRGMSEWHEGYLTMRVFALHALARIPALVRNGCLCCRQ